MQHTLAVQDPVMRNFHPPCGLIPRLECLATSMPIAGDSRAATFARNLRKCSSDLVGPPEFTAQ